MPLNKRSPGTDGPRRRWMRVPTGRGALNREHAAANADVSLRFRRAYPDIDEAPDEGPEASLVRAPEEETELLPRDHVHKHNAGSFPMFRLARRSTPKQTKPQTGESEASPRFPEGVGTNRERGALTRDHAHKHNPVSLPRFRPAYCLVCSWTTSKPALHARASPRRTAGRSALRIA